MLRVLGIDPGTLSVDFCSLLDGEVEESRSLPTAELARDSGALRRVLEELGRFDLVAAPSGYGLPLLRGEDVDERLLRLAFLAGANGGAGILGLRRAVVELIEPARRSSCSRVIHLPRFPTTAK